MGLSCSCMETYLIIPEKRTQNGSVERVLYSKLACFG